MSGQRLAVMRAVVERVIPADEWASGCAAGVDTYIERLLNGDGRKDREIIEAGLEALEAKGFGGRSAPEQDEILRGVENEAWFVRFIEMSMEGFYGDPGNGGNKGEVAWKMIGYDPGAARK